MAASPPLKITRGRVADTIVADLRRRILQGELPDGSKLPAERDLAAAYGVSGATVREAVRVLSSTGLIDVRHGSGSYVRASTDTLIATLFASVIDVERTNLVDLLDVAQALNSRAAQLAALRATTDELASLRDAARNLPDTSADQIIGGLKRFFTTLWAAAHSPLLTALARFLMDMQLDIAVELSAGRHDLWQMAARELAHKRVALVEALEAHEPDRAAAAVGAYHEQLLSIIDASPGSSEVRIDDPELADLVSTFLATRVSGFARER